MTWFPSKMPPFYMEWLALLAGGILTGVMGLRRRKLQSVAAEAGSEVNAE